MRKPFVGARVLYHTYIEGNVTALVADVLHVLGDGYQTDLSVQIPEGSEVFVKRVLGVPGTMRKDPLATGYWSWPES